MHPDDVAELFNHPLNDVDLQRILADLEADPTWQVLDRSDDGTLVTRQLLFVPGGSQVSIAQERSILGLWNSTI